MSILIGVKLEPQYTDQWEGDDWTPKRLRPKLPRILTLPAVPPKRKKRTKKKRK